MTKYLLSNAKLKKALVPTIKWSIPASESKEMGIITCPAKGICDKGRSCYAQQNFYLMPSTKAAHLRNLQLAESTDFVDTICSELSRKRVGDKGLAIRIHDSGDFYSMEYWMKWQAIIQQFPELQFYAYTKMVPMFNHIKKIAPTTIPANFTLIYSEGGKFDHLIDTSRDRHSRVFSSKEELMEAGYIDASKDDTMAWKGINHRVGLIYHGAAKDTWSTNKKSA